MAGGAITGVALTALILQCAGPDAPVPMLKAIIMQESGGNPDAVHINRHADGSVTSDHGLGQINSRNFKLLGLTKETVHDPCTNIRATLDFITILSRYNTGSATGGLRNGYDQSVMAKQDGEPVEVAHAPEALQPQPWDAFAHSSGPQFVFSQGK